MFYVVYKYGLLYYATWVLWRTGTMCKLSNVMDEQHPSDPEKIVYWVDSPTVGMELPSAAVAPPTAVATTAPATSVDGPPLPGGASIAPEDCYCIVMD